MRLCCGLFDRNFSAAHAAAAEGANFSALHLYDTVAGGVDGEVAADHGADAGALGHSNLADNNLTGLHDLTAEQLNA